MGEVGKTVRERYSGPIGLRSISSLWDVDNVRDAAGTLRSRYRDFAETEIALTAKSMMKQVSIRFTEAQL